MPTDGDRGDRDHRDDREAPGPVPLLPSPGPAGRGAGTEVLEQGRPERPRRGVPWSPWRRRAAALAVAAGAGVALVAGGQVPVGAWLDGRAAPAVDLRAAVGFSARSSPPPGGTISFYLAVRNVGAAPVTVLAAAADHRQVRLRSRDDIPRRLAAGEEVRVPVSARLTCAGASAGTAPVTVAVDVRRDDGSPEATTTPLDAGPLDDVATSACAARPGLRDVELSGVVLRGAADRAAG